MVAMETEPNSNWDAATEEDIYYCYRLFLDRRPERDGWRNYVANLEGGMSVQSLTSVFLNSVEFRNRQILASALQSQSLLVDLPDFKIYVSPVDSPIAMSIIEAKSYEPHVTAAMRLRLGPGMVFVDVGSNVGYLSLLASTLVGETGKVICFEPNQWFCKLIFMSAQANGFGNIEIRPFALGDRNKNVIYDDTYGNGTTSWHDDNLDSTTSRSIAWAMRLDDALSTEAAVHAIKMDVEGCEYLVLQGATEVLNRHRPIIFSEFSPAGLENYSGVSGKDFLKKLVNHGYDISVIGFDGGVVNYNDEVEQILNSFDRQHTSHIDIMAIPRA